MSGRTTMSGEYRVGGDPKRRALPSVTAAISLALTLACRATEPDEFGVYRGEQKLGRVVRNADRSVDVRMVV